VQLWPKEFKLSFITSEDCACHYFALRNLNDCDGLNDEMTKMNVGSLCDLEPSCKIIPILRQQHGAAQWTGG